MTMPPIQLQGRSRKVGNDINTDYIISSIRKKETLDPDRLKAFLFETVDPSLADSLQAGDILVAGDNFGCGSAMEVAVTTLVAAGVTAVLAKSFARTYYRNAVNNGLIPIECDTDRLEEGDELTVVFERTQVRIRCTERNVDLSGTSATGVARDILAAGGIVPYIRRHGGFEA